MVENRENHLAINDNLINVLIHTDFVINLHNYCRNYSILILHIGQVVLCVFNHLSMALVLKQ